jgi:hypothetical protein
MERPRPRSWGCVRRRPCVRSPLRPQRRALPPVRLRSCRHRAGGPQRRERRRQRRARRESARCLYARSARTLRTEPHAVAQPIVRKRNAILMLRYVYPGNRAADTAGLLRSMCRQHVCGRGPSPATRRPDLRRWSASGPWLVRKLVCRRHRPGLLRTGERRTRVGTRHREIGQLASELPHLEEAEE